MVKWLARKILEKEISAYKEKIRYLEFDQRENEDQIEQYKKVIANIDSAITENANLKKEVREMQRIVKENEVFREYYRMDEEPTEEIRVKIFTNLEINRLKEEMMKLEMMYYEREVRRLRTEIPWNVMMYRYMTFESF